MKAWLRRNWKLIGKWILGICLVIFAYLGFKYLFNPVDRDPKTSDSKPSEVHTQGSTTTTASGTLIYTEKILNPENGKRYVLEVGENFPANGPNLSFDRYQKTILYSDSDYLELKDENGNLYYIGPDKDGGIPGGINKFYVRLDPDKNGRKDKGEMRTTDFQPL